MVDSGGNYGASYGSYSPYFSGPLSACRGLRHERSQHRKQGIGVQNAHVSSTDASGRAAKLRLSALMWGHHGRG